MEFNFRNSPFAHEFTELKKRVLKKFLPLKMVYTMTVIELLIHAANGFLYFLIGVGILTFFFPTKMSLHHPQGILLGIGFTSSFSPDPQVTDIHYLFFSIHLLFFSLGVFINLGERHD